MSESFLAANAARGIQPSRPIAPPSGALVTLCGLKARPELNGLTGKVLGPEHSKEAAAAYAKGRIPVQLDDGGGTMLLKPDALEVANELPICDRVGKVAPEWCDYTYEQLCTMAADYFNKGVLMVAIECLQQAIDLEPDSFGALFQLGQVHEATAEKDVLPGSAQRAVLLYLTAMEKTAPDSSTPSYNEWCNAFVRAANLLISLPSAAKPPWWTSHGIKNHCGILLANPQGLVPDSDLLCPGWRIMAHAFEMERDEVEAARCYETAAGYSMEPTQCEGLLQVAAKLRST